MVSNFVLLVTVAVLIAAGVYMFLERTITKMLMGIMLIGNGVNLMILNASGPAGSPPIIGRESHLRQTTADPLAQAMILTAIVISMGLAAFILALAYRQHRYRVSDRIDDDPEDKTVRSRRADDPSVQPDHDATDDPTTGRPTDAGDMLGPKAFEKPTLERDREGLSDA